LSNEENRVFGLIRIYSNKKEWLIPYWMFGLAQYGVEVDAIYEIEAASN
jgi:hypothetical protein